MSGRYELWTVRCPVVEYADAREVQRRLHAARLAGEVPDVLLLLEHPPTYTCGRRSEPGDLPMGADWYRMQGIDVQDTDRGGKVTYHGPGQLVGYPIVSLDPYGNSIPDYVARMERVLAEALGAFSIEARAFDGETGVWTLREPSATPSPAPGRKIASIGVHVSRGVTTHGFAMNVNNDLQPFEWVVPCGMESCQMTSMCRELGHMVEMGEVQDVIADRWAVLFDRRAIERAPAELADVVEGTGALAGLHLSQN